MKGTIVWLITPCRLVEAHQSFGEHTATIFRVEEQAEPLPIYTVLQPRRSFSLL
jgi:hypothetical protein